MLGAVCPLKVGRRIWRKELFKSYFLTVKGDDLLLVWTDHYLLLFVINRDLLRSFMFQVPNHILFTHYNPAKLCCWFSFFNKRENWVSGRLSNVSNVITQLINGTPEIQSWYGYKITFTLSMRNIYLMPYTFQIEGARWLWLRTGELAMGKQSKLIIHIR